MKQKHDSSVSGDSAKAVGQPYPATPRPWHVFAPHGYAVALASGDGTIIAGFGPAELSDSTIAANAELIVRAVNAHDDLIEALAGARCYVRAALDYGGMSPVGYEYARDCLGRIDAALAKASPASIVSDKDTTGSSDSSVPSDGATDGGQPEAVQHWSDCAVNNGPAFEPGVCDCGGNLTTAPDSTPSAVTDEHIDEGALADELDVVEGSSGASAEGVERARYLLRNFSHDWDMKAGIQAVATALAAARAEGERAGHEAGRNEAVFFGAAEADAAGYARGERAGLERALATAMACGSGDARYVANRIRALLPAPEK